MLTANSVMSKPGTSGASRGLDNWAYNRVSLNHRPLYKSLRLLILLPVLALSACATLNKAECESGDWQAYGYDDGARGRGHEFYALHTRACAKHGVEVVAADYQRGYTLGVADYCIPETGFQLGLREGDYAYICPVEQEGEFLIAYRSGLQDALRDLHIRSYNLEDRLWHARLQHHVVSDAAVAEDPQAVEQDRRLHRLASAIENRIDTLRDREFRIRSALSRAARRLQKLATQTPKIQNLELQKPELLEPDLLKPSDQSKPATEA